ncbi:hypothetical protein LDENG_00252710 [Lucifuga dentata]|nr:hypothetical protein LDENG_00252710 [Lucifuga dentata]
MQEVSELKEEAAVRVQTPFRSEDKQEVQRQVEVEKMSVFMDEDEDGSASICLSMKTARSKEEPPYISDGPSDPKKRSDDGVEDQLSGCALCQDTLKDPVSTSRQSVSSDWDQSASPGPSSCPQRSTPSPGPQTPSQTKTLQTDGAL